MDETKPAAMGMGIPLKSDDAPGFLGILARQLKRARRMAPQRR